jgi:putative membrane protein
MRNNDKSQITEHLANEQTFLAWIRTGVEVMAFGFVAIKFSLFASQMLGIILVGIGALMTLFAYYPYRKTVDQLRKGHYKYSTVLLTTTAIILFIMSFILVFCLITAYMKPENIKKEKKETTDIQHPESIPKTDKWYFFDF